LMRELWLERYARGSESRAGHCSNGSVGHTRSVSISSQQRVQLCCQIVAVDAQGFFLLQQ
jgi:hypothetical protein